MAVTTAPAEKEVKSILLVAWLGLFALFRGINSLIIAFTLRHLGREAAAGPRPLA